MPMGVKIFLWIILFFFVWLILYCPVIADRRDLDGSIKMRFSRFLKLYKASPQNWELCHYGGPRCKIIKEKPKGETWYCPDCDEYNIFLPYFSWIRYKIWLVKLDKQNQEKNEIELYNDFITKYGQVLKEKQLKTREELEAAIADMEERLRKMSEEADICEKD